VIFLIDPYVETPCDEFYEWLKQEFKEVNVVRWCPAHQELPLVRHEEVKAVISLGSYAMVDDNHEWINGLGKTLLNLYKESKRMICICFSHQLLMSQLGSPVDYISKNKKMHTQLTKMKFSQSSETAEYFFHHAQKVNKCPEDFHVSGKSTFENDFLLSNNGQCLSAQAHVELDDTFEEMFEFSNFKESQEKSRHLISKHLKMSNL